MYLVVANSPIGINPEIATTKQWLVTAVVLSAVYEQRQRLAVQVEDHVAPVSCLIVQLLAI